VIVFAVWEGKTCAVKEAKRNILVQDIIIGVGTAPNVHNVGVAAAAAALSFLVGEKTQN
jgi:hypothetical protein